MVNIADKLEELAWILRYGRPKRKISSERMQSQLSLIEKPIFFLSTGRCGTKWFSNVLDQSPGVKVLHAPVPNFSMQNAYLYNLWQNKGISQKDRMEFSENLFTTGRVQHLRYLYKGGKRYIETNNHITFFAPALVKMFPDALFVHLYRHPGEFVRSGIRRGWFDHNQDATYKIIQPPTKDGDWATYNQVQKIAWVWNETNFFIEKFKTGIDSERHFTFNFNFKSPETVASLFAFLEIDVPSNVIDSTIEKKVNQQKTGDFPKYEDWSPIQKKELQSICGDLASKYKFTL